MGPILSSLVDLQVIETRVRKKRKELKMGQQVIKKQKLQIQQQEAALEAKREEIKLTKMQKDSLELDLKSKEDEVAKLRAALNSAKTNKEYSSILTRINTDKADNSKVEDQILALMTQIENDETACQELETSITEENTKLEEVSQRIEAKQVTIQSELDAIMAERQAAYDKVPEKHAVMFDRLAERYDGEVLGEIEKLNGVKGNYSCKGCYMKVPLEVVNSLMTRDDVIGCPTCGRIMILDPANV